MPFLLSARASELAREQNCGLRLEVRPGPVFARPMYLDFYYEEAPPREHAEFTAGGLRIWVPSHLTWIAEQEVEVRAGEDGHLYGAIEDVRTPW